MRVASDYGVLDIEPGQLVTESERRFSASKYAEAVLMARLAIAVADETTSAIVERAEALTDESLVMLSGEGRN